MGGVFLTGHGQTESHNNLGILGIEILRAFQESTECPICHLKHESALRYTNWTLHEYVNSPSFLGPFLQSVGLCQEHWGMFLAQGDLLGTSILTEAMLSQAIVQVDDSVEKLSGFGSRIPKRLRWARAFSWTTSLRPCHVCELEADAEHRYVWGVAKLCAEKAIDAACVGRILCFKHLIMVVREATPRDASEMLSVFRHKLEDLRENCRQIIGSFDYKFKGQKPDTAPLREAIRDVSLPGPGGQLPFLSRPIVLRR